MSLKNEYEDLKTHIQAALPSAVGCQTLEDAIEAWQKAYPVTRTVFSGESSQEVLGVMVGLFEDCGRLAKGSLSKNTRLFGFLFELFFYVQAKKNLLDATAYFSNPLNKSTAEKYTATFATAFIFPAFMSQYLKFLVGALSNSVEDVKSEAMTPFCKTLWSQLVASHAFEFQNDAPPPFYAESVHLLRVITENKQFVAGEGVAEAVNGLALNLLEFHAKDAPTSDKTDQKLAKICRNCIFSKANFSKKGLMARFVPFLAPTKASKEVLVDVLRVVCRLSDSPKLCTEIPIDGTLIQTLVSILETYLSDHYVISLALHFANNLVVAQDGYQRISDSPLMTSLLTTFEFYTQKVTQPARAASRHLRRHAQELRVLRVHSKRRPRHHRAHFGRFREPFYVRKQRPDVHDRALQGLQSAAEATAIFYQRKRLGKRGWLTSHFSAPCSVF